MNNLFVCAQSRDLSEDVACIAKIVVDCYRDVLHKNVSSLLKKCRTNTCQLWVVSPGMDIFFSYYVIIKAKSAEFSEINAVLNINCFLSGTNALYHLGTWAVEMCRLTIYKYKCTLCLFLKYNSRSVSGKSIHCLTESYILRNIFYTSTGCFIPMKRVIKHCKAWFFILNEVVWSYNND